MQNINLEIYINKIKSLIERGDKFSSSLGQCHYELSFYVGEVKIDFKQILNNCYFSSSISKEIKMQNANYSEPYWKVIEEKVRERKEYLLDLKENNENSDFLSI